MTDDEFWTREFNNINYRIGELDRFETEVIKRPNTDGKSKQLEAIKVNRDKLVDRANSASRSATK